MKARVFTRILAAAASVALSSCGAANSVYQTADRMVQAAGRTVTGSQ